MATSLRRRGQRTTLHSSEDVEQTAQDDIVTYATRALVPYKRDEEQPLLVGGQAIVFKATRTSPTSALRRKVETFAIKEIPIGDKKARHRLRKEIEHLRLCQHPNVLQLKEVYIIEQEEWLGRTFLVTQPWAQASLQRLLEDIANSSDGTSRLCPWYKPHYLHPWPTIVRQCILGLEHLHNNNIRHKDLKPDNILLISESDDNSKDSLEPRVRAMIADLGISKDYVEADKTTFNGTEQYLAPEQKAQASSTYRSDIFSLGCNISWIHALLSSKPWNLCLGNELGIFQLEELYQVGFGYSFREVLPLLKRLRQNPDSPKQQDMVDFLITLEDIIISTLLEEPGERLGLQTLLAKLDVYNAAWLESKTFKILDLCITSGKHTKVLELDFSAVKTDGEAFELIRKHCSMVTHYYSLDWLRSPREFNFIKFSFTNTYELLESPSIPSWTNLQAAKYMMPLTEKMPPIGNGFLLHLLNDSYAAGRHSCGVLLEALPIRRLTIHYHRDGSHTASTIRGPRWGVQIVKRLRVNPYLIGSASGSVPIVAAMYFFGHPELTAHQEIAGIFCLYISLMTTIMLLVSLR